MLQQTRSAAAVPYYEEFLRRFPTVEALARALESEVLAAWSGLGYYSRARNLHRAAAVIAEAGTFPKSYECIRALPGVGPYTAAAVASIAFGQPHAVLDGNVMRVLARITADGGDVAANPTKTRFQKVADELLDPERPSAFNQAMMELGATVCLPKRPLCLVCPVASQCEARARGLQEQLPVKLRKSAVIVELLEVVAIRQRERVLMRQRGEERSRMAGFWELPSLQSLPDTANASFVGEFQHAMVNHRYRVKVYSSQLFSLPDAEWISIETGTVAPITTISRKALALLKDSQTAGQ